MVVSEKDVRLLSSAKSISSICVTKAQLGWEILLRMESGESATIETVRGKPRYWKSLNAVALFLDKNCDKPRFFKVAQ